MFINMPTPARAGEGMPPLKRMPGKFATHRFGLTILLPDLAWKLIHRSLSAGIRAEGGMLSRRAGVG